MSDDKTNDKTEGQVISADWAPQDPRDRLYDKTASKREKSLSTLRIIASFHPVLNVAVILGDSIRAVGIARVLLILGLLLVGLVAWGVV